MADESNELKCIILTLKKENVIVPSAAVAEIISIEELDEVSDAPDWILGQFKWRGEEIPLISFEAAGGEVELTANRSTQVAVLYVLTLRRKSNLNRRGSLCLKIRSRNG